MDFDLWDFAEMEAIVPGIITGEIICENCGETIEEGVSRRTPEIILCPHCGNQQKQ